MPRNDSVLLTGMNSGTVSKVDRERMARLKKEKQEKISKKNTVLPTIEPVLAEIDKEKQKTTLRLLESIDTVTTEEDVKAIIASLNLYKESMNNLKTKINNIMRIDVKKGKK